MDEKFYKVTKLDNGLNQIEFFDIKELAPGDIPDNIDVDTIEKVIIPNTVVTLKDSSFNQWEKLKYVKLSESLEVIESEVFASCMSLESIYIPASVKSIGTDSFTETGLKEIKVDEHNKYFDSRENCNAIIRKSDSCLIAGCENTIIPNSIKSIGRCAFYGCNKLKTIVLPNNLEEIHELAFSECESLETISIPSSVKIFEYGVFENCESLKTAYIPANVDVDEDGFYGCPEHCIIKKRSGTPPDVLDDVLADLFYDQQVFLSKAFSKLFKKYLGYTLPKDYVLSDVISAIYTLDDETIDNFVEETYDYDF